VIPDSFRIQVVGCRNAKLVVAGEILIATIVAIEIELSGIGIIGPVHSLGRIRVRAELWSGSLKLRNVNIRSLVTGLDIKEPVFR
jgi:hypothetical protein